MIDVGLLNESIDGCGESTKVIVKLIAEDNVLAWRRVEQLREENTWLRKGLERIAKGAWTSSGDLAGATWDELIACRIAKETLEGGGE